MIWKNKSIAPKKAPSTKEHEGHKEKLSEKQPFSWPFVTFVDPYFKPLPELSVLVADEVYMLKIPKSIYDDILLHSLDGFPLEVCGILGGKDGVVSAFYRMTNTDQSNEHFMMDPKEQFSVVKDLRAKGIEMAAIYHSHPETPARPSEEDIRLALTPGVSYVIVSLMNGEKPDLKSFKIDGNIVTPENVEIFDHI